MPQNLLKNSNIGHSVIETKESTDYNCWKYSYSVQ